MKNEYPDGMIPLVSESGVIIGYVAESLYLQKPKDAVEAERIINTKFDRSLLAKNRKKS